MTIRITSYEHAVALGLGHLWREQAAMPKRPSKYGNVRTLYNGYRYASKAEALRAERLDFELSIGHVLRWERQPRFELGVPENVYVADFLVETREGVHVEDVKGVYTSKFQRDKKLWRAYGAHPLWIVKRGKCVEIIEPGGAKGD